MNLESAIEVFVRGFCAVKSRTHPYIPTWHEGFWVLRDAPKKCRYTRKIEVISTGIPPRDLVAHIKELELPWHFVVDIHEPEVADAAKAAYKALGYRAIATEWLFVYDLANLTSEPAESSIVRLDSPGQAAGLSSARGKVIFWPPARKYVWVEDNRALGFVSSVPVGEHAWVSDLWVDPRHRRKGIGGALMRAMLQDDRAFRVQTSVLVASKAGSKLYPTLGYAELGTLQVFCPKDR